MYGNCTKFVQIAQAYARGRAEIILISVRKLTRFGQFLRFFRGGGGAWGPVEVALDE